MSSVNCKRSHSQQNKDEHSFKIATHKDPLEHRK